MNESYKVKEFTVTMGYFRQEMSINGGITMVLPALKKKEVFTYGDYLKWDNDERWELIDGIAYNMSPAPYKQHCVYRR